MMKQNLGTAAFAGCLMVLLAAPGAARAATISFSATGGSSVSVTVAVAGIEALAEPSLGAYDLDLTFDTAVLSFSDIEFGTFLGGPADSFQSENVAGGLVDFAEVSLIFPNVLLQDLQPDSFVLATINFGRVELDATTTTLALTQTVLSDGNGLAIPIAPVGPIELELQAAIPEVGGIHVFGIGLLVVLAGQWLRPTLRMATRQDS